MDIGSTAARSSATSAVSRPTTLACAARAVLECPDTAGKLRMAHDVAALWRDGGLRLGADGAMPDRPRRPTKPALLAPNAMPRRSFKGLRGRIALLHALAHIELNAVDLAFDIVGRFSAEDLPRHFFDDWIQVGEEEALHFALLQGRLATMGAAYGDLPAHDGLWQAAYETRTDLLGRLALVPMVFEARGLDVTPAMIARLAAAGDRESAEVLARIYRDEQRHVAAGVRWFEHLCAERGIDGRETFQALVRQHFRGPLKPPFNVEAREMAGFAKDYYEPLSAC